MKMRRRLGITRNMAIILALFVMIGAYLLLCNNLSEQVTPIVSRGLETTSPIPGGLKVKGVCNLQEIKEQVDNGAFDLAIHPKHGLHTMHRFFPRNCPARVKYHLLTAGRSIEAPPAYSPTTNVEEFIQRKNRYKILTVRSPESFYKSGFNHVCNKVTPDKVAWRKQHGVNCTHEGEFHKILKLDRNELAPKLNPFELKEIVMESPEVQQIMLIDYACMSKVVSSLCHKRMSRKIIDSAKAEGYTDFWSMHNYDPPVTPFAEFWHDIYEILSDKNVCCLELVKDDARPRHQGTVTRPHRQRPAEIMIQEHRKHRHNSAEGARTKGESERRGRKSGGISF